MNHEFKIACANYAVEPRKFVTLVLAGGAALEVFDGAQTIARLRVSDFLYAAAMSIAVCVATPSIRDVSGNDGKVPPGRLPEFGIRTLRFHFSVIASFREGSIDYIGAKAEPVLTVRRHGYEDAVFAFRQADLAQAVLWLNGLLSAGSEA